PEPAGGSKRSVDLICRDLQEPPDARAARRLQQHLRAESIRAREGHGLQDRTVDVALCREIHDGIHAGSGPRDRVKVADVALPEPEPRARHEITHVAEIAAVREEVQDGDLPLAPRLEQVANEVRSDEATTSGHEQLHVCSATRLETRSRLSGVPAS